MDKTEYLQLRKIQKMESQILTNFQNTELDKEMETIKNILIDIINEVKATCVSNSSVWPIIRKKNLSYNS